MLAIGMMSGTSVDAIDVALVEIVPYNNDYKYELIDFVTYDINKNLKDKILECSNTFSSNVQKLCSLNFEIAYEYNKAIKKLLNNNHNIDDIEFISIHGQTVWHNPGEMDGYFSSTLQICEPAVIAYEFNKKVISNFRTMDMAASGCGAPLMPYPQYKLFKNYGKTLALQNIGGIGNVTYIKKNSNYEDMIAFDTGPGNMMIDRTMQLLYNKEYDESGSVGKSGNKINEMLEELMSDEYFNLNYPKSTGREKYNDEFVQNIINKYTNKGYAKNDIVSTFTHFTAYSISDQYEKFLQDVEEIVVTGGGSHNDFLLDLIRQYTKKEVKTGKEININSDALEAIGFAILGHLNIIGEEGNSINVTGASKRVVLGNVTYPPLKKGK